MADTTVVVATEGAVVLALVLVLGVAATKVMAAMVSDNDRSNIDSGGSDNGVASSGGSGGEGGDEGDDGKDDSGGGGGDSGRHNICGDKVTFFLSILIIFYKKTFSKCQPNMFSAL